MSDSRQAHRWLALLGFAGIFLAGFATPVAGNGSSPAAQGTELEAESAKAARSYIVRMADAPVSSYDGGRPGYAATSPGRGEKMNPMATAPTPRRRPAAMPVSTRRSSAVTSV